MAAYMGAIVVQVILLCMIIFIDKAIAAGTQRAQSSTLPSFDWSSVHSSEDLVWQDCYSSPSTRDSGQYILSSPSRKLSCALLSLPLEYRNETSSLHHVSLPIIKASSPASTTHRGTIFTALGGAGNSRIQDFVTILSSFPFLDLIDPEFEYDFLTFDNRGFGYSSPSARCFDSVLESDLWEERMTDLCGVMRTGDDQAIQVRLAAATAKGDLCKNQSVGDYDIRRHMTTAYAARDMLEILKRVDKSSSQSSLASTSGNEVGKLQFLGLSYGTVLGQTFASLYPEQVSRMVLDGAGNPSDWTGKWQTEHLNDTDAVWASFYNDCLEAKKACELWRESDSGAADIEKRVSGLLKALKLRPAYTVNKGNARLITERDVKIAIYWTTMSPVFLSSSMATVLDGMIRGHTNVSFPFEHVPLPSYCPGDGYRSPDIRARANADAGSALNCGDAEDITNSTVAEFKEYLSELESQSTEAGFYQGERRVRCMGWPIRPAWRFTGPFTSKTENGSSKLPTPILFIGNKLDPMTSIKNSRQVVNDYPGSVVLEQNARGHCAFGGVVNSCIVEHVRRYFRNGTLPDCGTVCGEDCNLFDGSCLNEGTPSDHGLLFQKILR